MSKSLLIHMGAALTAIWGVMHLFPTMAVVRGFGDISTDNRRIITMEWILEGVSLVVLGAFVSTATVIDPSSLVTKGVYLVAELALILFALVSLFTAFRIDFLAYKLCPFVFGVSAGLILIGGFS